MIKWQGDLIAEITLYCQGQPLPRGRAVKGYVNQSLANQAEMLLQLKAQNYLNIDIPMIITIECGYKKFHYGAGYVKHDVDNVAKGVLDNLQRTFIIKNDNLVMGVSCVKYPDKEDIVSIRIFKAIGFDYVPKTLPRRVRLKSTRGSKDKQ